MVSEPKGRGAPWTEEQEGGMGRWVGSDEGREHLESGPEASEQITDRPTVLGRARQRLLDRRHGRQVTARVLDVQFACQSVHKQDRGKTRVAILEKVGSLDILRKRNNGIPPCTCLCCRRCRTGIGGGEFIIVFGEQGIQQILSASRGFEVIGAESRSREASLRSVLGHGNSVRMPGLPDIPRDA